MTKSPFHHRGSDEARARGFTARRRQAETGEVYIYGRPVIGLSSVPATRLERNGNLSFVEFRDGTVDWVSPHEIEEAE